MFNKKQNNVKIDGNGNITLQDINGTIVNVNINDTKELNEIIKQLPEQIAIAIKEQIALKEENILTSLKLNISTYLSSAKEIWSKKSNSLFYISQDAKTLSEGENLNVINYIGNNRNSSFLILGNSGLGKSTLALKYFSHLIIDFNNIELSIIPVYLDLKNLETIKSVNSLIRNAFSSFKIELQNNEIDYLISRKKVFFVLDGFDEIGCRSDMIEAEKSIKKILQLPKLGFGFFLTCRTQYFKSIQSIKQISQSEYLKVLTLTPWTKNQITTYIKKVSGDSDDILKSIFSIYNLEDLCSTPLLLSMIIDSICHLGNYENITSSKLYNIYIENWLIREESNTVMPWTEKEDFISNLSWKMYIKDVSKIHFKEIEKELTIQFRPNFTEKYYLSNSIRTRSLLARNDDGFYFFQHRSFMEFIVARMMIESLRNMDLTTFGAKQVYHDISIFMRGLIRKEDLVLLMNILTNEQANEIARFHAANLLTSTFTVLTKLEFPENELLEHLEKCLLTEKSIMVARQIVYVICFIKGNEGAVSYLTRLKTNPSEDKLDTFFALKYFGKNLDDAINGHIKHLITPKYHKHLIMDLYHLGKIGRLSEIKEIEIFCSHDDSLVSSYASEAIELIKQRNLP